MDVIKLCSKSPPSTIPSIIGPMGISCDSISHAKIPKNSINYDGHETDTCGVFNAFDGKVGNAC
jgi:hypothetical protein